MEQHVRTLAYLFMVAGIVSGLGAMILLIWLGGFEGIMAVAERADFASGPFLQVLRFLGSGLTLIMLLLAAPSIIAGVGLLSFKGWARSLAMVVSTLQLANFPLGTCLALYSFWVLMSQETEPLFTDPPSLRY